MSQLEGLPSPPSYHCAMSREGLLSYYIQDRWNTYICDLPLCSLLCFRGQNTIIIKRCHYYWLVFVSPFLFQVQRDIDEPYTSRMWCLVKMKHNFVPSLVYSLTHSFSHVFISHYKYLLSDHCVHGILLWGIQRWTRLVSVTNSISKIY